VFVAAAVCASVLAVVVAAMVVFIVRLYYSLLGATKQLVAAHVLPAATLGV
jgi:hypothetical protein